MDQNSHHTDNLFFLSLRATLFISLGSCAAISTTVSTRFIAANDSLLEGHYRTLVNRAATAWERS